MQHSKSTGNKHCFASSPRSVWYAPGPDSRRLAKSEAREQGLGDFSSGIVIKYGAILRVDVVILTEDSAPVYEYFLSRRLRNPIGRLRNREEGPCGRQTRATQSRFSLSLVFTSTTSLASTMSTNYDDKSSDKSGLPAPTTEARPVTRKEKYLGSSEQKQNRTLLSRHLTFVALGGTLGTGECSSQHQLEKMERWWGGQGGFDIAIQRFEEGRAERSSFTALGRGQAVTVVNQLVSQCRYLPQCW